MKYNIYLFEIAENGKICGLWWDRKEFVKFLPNMLGRWFVDKNCKIPATSDNIYFA